MDENNQRKDSATQQVLTNRPFVHSTTNNTRSTPKPKETTNTMIPPATRFQRL
jgi:hypothetical protein